MKPDNVQYKLGKDIDHSHKNEKICRLVQPRDLFRREELFAHLCNYCLDLHYGVENEFEIVVWVREKSEKFDEKTRNGETFSLADRSIEKNAFEIK